MRNPALIVLYVLGILFTILGLMLAIGQQYNYESALAGASSAALSPLVGLEAIQLNLSVIVFTGTVLALGLLSLLLALTATAIGRSTKNAAKLTH